MSLLLVLLFPSHASPSTIPPGTLPSFNSLSSLVISARLFAFRIMTSTLFRSFSVNFTRTPLLPFVVVPFVVLEVEGSATSKVRDLMLRIW